MMVAQIVFLFLARRFSEKRQRKWTSTSQEYYCQRQNRQQFSMIFTIINHRTGHQKVQNFAMKPLTRIRLVVLLEFWTFDFIFKVDKSRDVKSTDHGKLLSMSIFSPTSGRHSPPPPHPWTIMTRGGWRILRGPRDIVYSGNMAR